MPTVMQFRGLRLAICPNDHPPAHVHELGLGWAVAVGLRTAENLSIVAR
jgi:hypothetical protein